MEKNVPQIDRDWLNKQLLQRFDRYVRIETTSDRHVENIPSTECQWDLITLLKKELTELGIEDIQLDENGYLIARLPANGVNQGTPCIGFMAHIDTASELPGKARPQIHENYQGGPIELKRDVVIDPEEFPELKERIGDTIITADGTTLLGADDKAGVAECITAAAWFMSHPDTPHGPVEFIFTPDEETGKGMNLFPAEKLQSDCCYTMDGDGDGVVEAECFHGHTVKAFFKGRVVHPGRGRGKLVNAVTMASTFMAMLPRNETPEATDGRYGFFCPMEIKGSMGEAEVEIYIRDFEIEEVKRRIQLVRSLALIVEGLFPGGKIEVEALKMYENMRDGLVEFPQVLELLEEAIRMTGTEPEKRSIRGGTDGARLTEMGIPSPNVFNGGCNFHSNKEWASLELMRKATKTIVYLVGLWASKG